MKDPKLVSKLEHRYWVIVNTLNAIGGTVYADDLIEMTGMKKSQLSSALQYGRRQFDPKIGDVRNYVMSSGGGLFLPENEDECVAYVVQTLKDATSRWKTLMPILDYAEAHFHDKLVDAMNVRTDEDEDDDEMTPWAVFDSVMERNNRLTY